MYREKGARGKEDEDEDEDEEDFEIGRKLCVRWKS